MLARWTGSDPTATPEYREYSQRFTNNMWAMISDLLQSLDTKQRRHLVSEFERYANDFEELAIGS